MITDITQIETSRLKNRVSGNPKKNQLVVKTKSLDKRKNIEALEEYSQYFQSLIDTRERFRRSCKFNRGDQWSDTTTDSDGNSITEEAWIKRQGKLPLKQNIIRPLVKSLLGLFRSGEGRSIVISRKPDSADVEDMLSNALQSCLDQNETREIDPRTLELFILSGLPIQKVSYGLTEMENYDGIVEYIDPNYIFFNSDIKDIRLKDLRVIGQVHDNTFDEIKASFAHNDADVKRLKEIYPGTGIENSIDEYGLSDERTQCIDFYIPSDISKCRVIEVWKKVTTKVIEYWDKVAGEEGIWDGTVQQIEDINEARRGKFTVEEIPEQEQGKYLIVYDTNFIPKWFYQFLSPFGDVLSEGETPYAHKSYPFVMYPYPLINGEVWGPIEDVIDQQKYVNRLVTLQDFVIGSGVKNAIAIDVNSLNGQSAEKIAKTYKEIGGVMVLNLKNGAKPPMPLGTNANNLGVTELIGLQLKWMQDISGVQPAMQGQAPSAGTPSSRYAMESVNASNNNRDLIDSFNAFRKRRDQKLLMTLIQYYDTERYIACGGKKGSILYNPDKVKALGSEFDLTIAQSTDSPVYKSWVEDSLKEFVIQGFIDIRTYLAHSTLPFAKEILADLSNQQKQMEGGQITPGQAAKNVNQDYKKTTGTDPTKINQLEKMIRK